MDKSSCSGQVVRMSSRKLQGCSSGNVRFPHSYLVILGRLNSFPVQNGPLREIVREMSQLDNFDRSSSGQLAADAKLDRLSESFVVVETFLQ